MAEAKDIDNSLDFLRYFEKYTESEDLLSVVQHKMEQNSKALDLIRQELSEDDCKLLADLAPLVPPSATVHRARRSPFQCHSRREREP